MPSRITAPLNLSTQTLGFCPRRVYIAAVTSSFSLYAERVLFPNQPPTVVVQNAGLIVMTMGLLIAFIQIFLIQPLARWLGEQTLIIVGAGALLISAIGFSAANNITM